MRSAPDAARPAAQRLTTDVLLIGLTVYAVGMMAYRFADVPGLHADEAWGGLRALDMRDRGLVALHGLRRYAGSLHPFLLSRVFAALGASVASLRLPGLLLNIAGFTILVGVLLQQSRRAATLFAAFACTSLLMLLQARMAWEVMSYNLFGLSCLAAAAHAFLKRGGASSAWALLFLLANAIGALNHFVFVSASLAVCLGAVLLWATRRAEPQPGRFLWLNVVNLGMVALLVGSKLLISDNLFAGHAAALALTLAVAPVLATILFVMLAPAAERFLKDRRDQLRLRGSPNLGIWRWPLALAAAGLLTAFFGMHAAGLFGVLTNGVLVRRLFAYVPPAWYVVLGAGFAVLLLVSAGVAGWCALRRSGRGPADCYEVFWAVLPPLYAACFPLFTSRESARHFLILATVLFFAVAVHAERLERRLVRALFALTLGFCVATQALVWQNLSNPPRPPIDFTIGWRKETSRHLLPTIPLYELLKEHDVCRYDADFFIAVPLEFLRRADAWDCAGNTPATVTYCEECPNTFFFALQAPSGRRMP